MVEVGQTWGSPLNNQLKKQKVAGNTLKDKLNKLGINKKNAIKGLALVMLTGAAFNGFDGKKVKGLDDINTSHLPTFRNLTVEPASMYGFPLGSEKEYENMEITGFPIADINLAEKGCNIEQNDFDDIVETLNKESPINPKYVLIACDTDNYDVRGRFADFKPKQEGNKGPYNAPFFKRNI